MPLIEINEPVINDLDNSLSTPSDSLNNLSLNDSTYLGDPLINNLDDNQPLLRILVMAELLFDFLTSMLLSLKINGDML